MSEFSFVGELVGHFYFWVSVPLRTFPLTFEFVMQCLSKRKHNNAQPIRLCDNASCFLLGADTNHELHPRECFH